LLLSNDCVIVPNFGGFMTHSVNARRCESENIFLPPYRTLGFNPQLTMNDSLLAQSYVETYDISYPEALRKIEDEVRELRQHIENEGQYEMSGLGTISLNDEGKYIFEPCEAGILTPKLYGLDSFEFKKLKAQTTESIAQNVAPKAKTITIKVSHLRNIAAACVAVLALMLLPQQNTSNNVAVTQSSIISTNVLRQMMPKEIKAEAQKIDVAKATAKQVETQKAQPKIVTAEPTNYFCIVLASKVSKTNANAFVDHLHKNGFDAAKVLSRESGNKVIYGQYETEAKAYSALRELRSLKDFRDGWVMQVK